MNEQKKQSKDGPSPMAPCEVCRYDQTQKAWHLQLKFAAIWMEAPFVSESTEMDYNWNSSFRLPVNGP